MVYWQGVCSDGNSHAAVVMVEAEEQLPIVFSTDLSVTFDLRGTANGVLYSSICRHHCRLYLALLPHLVSLPDAMVQLRAVPALMVVVYSYSVYRSVRGGHSHRLD